jgi:hypothetical protein
MAEPQAGNETSIFMDVAMIVAIPSRHHLLGKEPPMKRRPAIIATIAAALVVLCSAVPAMAVSWGTIVVYENQVEQGRAYGSFYNQSYQYAAMDAYFKDSRAGGNGVFVDIDYHYWVQECPQCQPTYAKMGNDQTGRTTSGSWAGPSHQTFTLWASSNSARGAIQVCEDQAWSADPCSEPDALPTFSY